MTTPPTRTAELLRTLTPREAQALAHLAAGHDLRRTAAALGVTPDTVRGHLHRAMRKLGCPTEAAAIALVRTATPTGPGGRPPAPQEPAAGDRKRRPGTGPGHEAPPKRQPAPAPADQRDRAVRRTPPAEPAPEAHGKQHPSTRREAPSTPNDPGERSSMAPTSTANTGQRPAAPTPPTGGKPRPAPAPAPDTPPVPQNAPRPPADPRERISTALTEAASGRELADDLGPTESFEELYEGSYTRLVQQMFLLTACRHRAVHCVRRAFGEARRDWGAVAGAGDPEVWVRVRACELALSPWRRGGPRRVHPWTLPHRRIRVRPADEAQAVLPDHDRLTDQDRALLKALRRLSRPQRRALVLHDGLGLPAAAIALEVESTRTAAESRVWAARAALAQWVPELVGPDPAAPGFADGLSRLLHRAAVRGCPEPHREPVPVLRARHRMWTAGRTGAAALLTVAVGGATLATLAGARPAALFRPPDPPSPTLCMEAPGVAAKAAANAPDGPGVPLLPGGAPNGINSLWCSPAPGLEAVVLDPQPRAAARWELPAVARHAPPPPQGPAACPRWTELPCTTGPTH
ncbi:sigma factor-like helix-turn-helix DNA-binding protein [Kitasatospora sp. SUK 42]|uniref:sigma factor-like helix-turn-helix DNA-binding protein n=1 Tax=Kitasatospora sp. SUK 42 TaxID=1588882 RepID=UPI0018C9A750|nr:sigma factor-like helix-turn-helix DNA-binding protein [Kitasatospora sp. SUK 42]MBV2154363.1 LuxR C-terminal-related transcriptional regulator [Kitasatospora sp. SUK 42]